jgi:deoxyribonuclease-4
MGNTIKKERGSIFWSVSQYMTSLAAYPERWANPCCQLYIHPPRSKVQLRARPDDLAQAKAAISDHQIMFYTHTPYIINLCDLEANSRGESPGSVAAKVLQIVKDDLNWTAQLGGKGVVIHTGKYKTLTPREGALRMRNSVLQLLEHASPQAPLLLETGAGQGTELLCSAQGMASFYHCIPTHLKDRFGICVDTCHCFSANYDPYEYILELAQLAPGAIKMIHYNNSRVPKGSRHDAHAPLLDGYIDIKCLYDVAIWARKNEVPIIRE